MGLSLLPSQARGLAHVCWLPGGARDHPPNFQVYGLHSGRISGLLDAEMPAAAGRPVRATPPGSFAEPTSKASQQKLPWWLKSQKLNSGPWRINVPLPHSERALMVKMMYQKIQNPLDTFPSAADVLFTHVLTEMLYLSSCVVRPDFRPQTATSSGFCSCLCPSRTPSCTASVSHRREQLH